MSVYFVCDTCGASTPSLAPAGWRCACGSPWSLPPGPAFDPHAGTDAASGVWRFRRQIRLPAGPVPTLGEGCGRWLHPPGGPRIALAYLEPTLSFKDRGVAVLLAWAALAATPPLIEDSSGNAGGSFAAYAAAAGLPCRIYVPSSAPAGKTAALRAFGAEIIEVDGPRANATEAALADPDGTYCSHAWNPMFLEGTKTMALQWWQEHGGVLPRRVYVPVGQGSIALGLYHGFTEIRAGVPEFRIPEIIAVQHRTAAPLWQAVGAPSAAGESDPACEPDAPDPACEPDPTGAPDHAPLPEPAGAPDHAPLPEPADIPSLADGIAIDKPVRQEALVRAIKDTGGRVIVVGNEEILDAQQRLAGIGVWAEPTGAVAMAGHTQAGDGNDALVVVTGHGLKATL